MLELCCTPWEPDQQGTLDRPMVVITGDVTALWHVLPLMELSARTSRPVLLVCTGLSPRVAATLNGHYRMNLAHVVPVSVSSEAIGTLALAAGTEPKEAWQLVRCGADDLGVLSGVTIGDHVLAVAQA